MPQGGDAGLYSIYQHARDLRTEIKKPTVAFAASPAPRLTDVARRPQLWMPPVSPALSAAANMRWLPVFLAAAPGTSRTTCRLR